MATSGGGSGHIAVRGAYLPMDPKVGSENDAIYST